jgi:hypothetical protein
VALEWVRQQALQLRLEGGRVHNLRQHVHLHVSGRIQTDKDERSDHRGTTAASSPSMYGHSICTHSPPELRWSHQPATYLEVGSEGVRQAHGAREGRQDEVAHLQVVKKDRLEEGTQ